MDGDKQWKALATRVLVVAVEGAVDDWACYVDAVEGQSHRNEYMEVARRGTKLPESIANLLFPHWKKLNYRR